MAASTRAEDAWYGRVSTEDEQDPTLSFPRQLANAERQVEEAGGRIVAHYYDIESGTRAYTARARAAWLASTSRSPETAGSRTSSPTHPDDRPGSTG